MLYHLFIYQHKKVHLFFFASTSNSNDSSCSTSVYSTGVDSIKTLPSTVWLPESIPVKQEKEQQNEYRLPMVSHLLSLPVNAYVASSSNRSTLPSFETEDQPLNRLPMVNQLLSMPINAFKSSSNIQPINETTPVEIEDKKEPVNNNNNNKVSSIPEPPKSILDTETIYSKEYWLRKGSSSEGESVPLDLNTYIEQTTDKMRRLHTEYLEALEKIKIPSNPIDPSQIIKSMYPQMLDRIKQNTSTKDPTPALPSNK